ncbi:MAG: FmdB family zinc ribbon protein [Anaerolineales bacterium]
MPTYDYRCRECGRHNSIYQTYEEYDIASVVCQYCSSQKLERIIDRIRVARSEESRIESLADPSSWGDVDESDPRSMAKMMRKMGDELGEEMPQEFDEVIGRLESGESPEEIEKNLPDQGMENGY